MRHHLVWYCNKSRRLTGRSTVPPVFPFGFQEATRNTSSASNGQLVFDYGKLSDGSLQTANILTLQSNGNVGVGTASPGALFHVATPVAGHMRMVLNLG